MNRQILAAAIAFSFLAIIPPAMAQSNVYSGNIVGYVTYAFQPGDNLFGNPLSGGGTSSGSETLSSIFLGVPDGASISLWSSVGGAFSQTSTFSSGAWSIDFVLSPGQGALLHAPSRFTNTFVGGVLAPDGSDWGGDSINPPPPFMGPSGVYLLSSKCPIEFSAASGFTVFNYVLGRAPQEGEQFTTLDALTQTYYTTTFTSGAWNNGNPVLHVGEAAFFNIGPAVVPEPSVAALLVVGLCLGRLISRRR
jgi:hypothetical protein